MPLGPALGVCAALQTTVLRGGGWGGGAWELNQTESQVFVVLCVLCFQRQSVFTFIYVISHEITQILV